MRSVIAYFKDEVGLLNFRGSGLNPFLGNFSGSLHSIRLKYVMLYSFQDGNKIILEDSSSIGIDNLIPGCISCLEKIESSVTGLHVQGK